MGAHLAMTLAAQHLLGLGSILALGAQLPLHPPSPLYRSGATSRNAPSNKILDDDFDDWLMNLTSFWGMKGLSVAVVRQHKDDDGKWDVETKGYGAKNEVGDAVTEDVSCPYHFHFRSSLQSVRLLLTSN